MGCSFFCPLFESKKDVGLGMSITIFIIGSLAFVAIELTEESSKESIRTTKLTNLNTVVHKFKTKHTDEAVNKQLREIHNELKKINENIEEIKSGESKNNIDTKEITKKMEELKDMLTPIDLNSDMFKAYTSAIVEI